MIEPDTSFEAIYEFTEDALHDIQRLKFDAKAEYKNLYDIRLNNFTSKMYRQINRYMKLNHRHSRLPHIYAMYVVIVSEFIPAIYGRLGDTKYCETAEQWLMRSKQINTMNGLEVKAELHALRVLMKSMAYSSYKAKLKMSARKGGLNEEY